jgi:ABC-2 type transport system permease protein
MRKVWIIIKREYLTRVRSKTFLLTTIALPLVSAGLLAFSVFVATRQVTHPLRIAIVDQAGGLGPAVVRNLDEKLPSGKAMFDVLETIESPPRGAEAHLRQEVESGRLDGYLIVPKGVVDGKQVAEFHARNTGLLTLASPLSRAVSDAVIARRLQTRGLKVDDVQRVVRSVGVKMIKVTQSGEVVERGQTFLTAIVVGMLLYITLIAYGVTTMRSVIEEKSTRIIELLIASVRPFHLMTGKILGVAGVALTQYLIWAMAGAVLAAYGGAMAGFVRPGASLPPLHLSAALVAYAVLFFLAGYLLYASVYAAIGAMVSSEQDAQQIQLPVTLVIVVSFLLFNVILRNPNSRTAVTLSMIPFLSPILMVLRIAVETPPFWQIAVSLGLSLAATLEVVLVSARIYRVGVLMYGKRPSLLEIARWLRYT